MSLANLRLKLFRKPFFNQLRSHTPVVWKKPNRAATTHSIEQKTRYERCFEPRSSEGYWNLPGANDRAINDVWSPLLTYRSSDFLGDGRPDRFAIRQLFEEVGDTRINHRQRDGVFLVVGCCLPPRISSRGRGAVLQVFAADDLHPLATP